MTMCTLEELKKEVKKEFEFTRKETATFNIALNKSIESLTKTTLQNQEYIIGRKAERKILRYFWSVVGGLVVSVVIFIYFQQLDLIKLQMKEDIKAEVDRVFAEYREQSLNNSKKKVISNNNNNEL